MSMKFKLLFFILFISINCVFSQQNVIDNSSDAKTLYESEKITYKIKQYFDPMYPLAAKDISLFKGNKKISMEEFFLLSQDPLLVKNKEMIKKIKLSGFTTAIIFGSISSIFFVSSAIFIALQATYYTNKANFKSLGYDTWLDYFNGKYGEYFLPGLICIGLTGFSLVALIIELTVTFALLHKYSFNERVYKEAIERYNQKLKEKYRWKGDLGFIKNDILFSLSVNL